MSVETDAIREKQYDVLVSYQRADDDERRELVEALHARGYEVFWDGKLGPDYWRVEWRSRMLASKLMVVLWSQTAAKSPEVQVEAGGALALKKCLSVELDGRRHVPKPYLETNRHRWDRTADAATRKAQLDAILARIEAIIGPPRASVAPPPAAAIPADLGDIPAAPGRLIGRDDELAMLRSAWASSAPKKVNTVVLHALGGAGKSALLRTFANEMLAAGGNGADGIYGWSAYSQGSGDQKRADADSFISKALVDFGFKGEPPNDPVERARALVALIRQQRILLLLDGLEPLQDPPAVNRGRFKDKGLAELVRLLSASNPGLMVVTTRQEVPELQGSGTVVIDHALDRLSDRAGADLLVELGVRGRQRDLEQAVHDLEGHALSITLLGTFLSEVCGGDIRHREQFNFADLALSPEEESELLTDKTIVPAKRAAKVMRGYLEQLDKLATDEATAGLGGPERAILQLVGLFDRPADGAAVAALLATRIPGLTDELFVEPVRKSFLGFYKFLSVRTLTPSERAQRIRRAKERLRKLQLISKPNLKDPQELDAHPIVRAFFAGRLEETAPEAAKAAHDILFNHYCASTPEKPDSLEAMQPLIHALQHGVKAGRAQAAYKDVYAARIMSEQQLFDTPLTSPMAEAASNLFLVTGAYNTALAAVFVFLRKGEWAPGCEHLGDRALQRLRADCAIYLSFCERNKDSAEINALMLANSIAKADWAEANTRARELSDLYLLLGRVDEAMACAHQSMTYIQRQTTDSGRLEATVSLCNAVTAAGDAERGRELFQEIMHLVLNQSDFAIFDRLEEILGPQRILRLSAFLDSQSMQDLALEHFGDDTLQETSAFISAFAEFPEDIQALIEKFIGFYHLFDAMAVFPLDPQHSRRSFDHAIASFRSLNIPDFLAVALLRRASYARRQCAGGDTHLLPSIRADLDEVEAIAGEEMRLHLTDLALERARLALDLASAWPTAAAARADAIANLDKARTLVEATGYHRRAPDLAEIERRLALA